MTTSPSLFQKRLEQHFSSLARIRQKSALPIFAMEHGLSDLEIEQLQLTLRTRRQRNILPNSEWLLWVIYATEVGYKYTGEEYWQSFEEQTPGWTFHDRKTLKSWFVKFQHDYNGVQPSGPWAHHFTIIAWPITHAILPVYLQRQFARALFDLRYKFVSMTDLDPKKIGRLVAINAHIPTTRFQEFLQQEEMIGRIVRALLGETALEGDHLIYPRTLERIVADLDKVRSSREWLKDARQIVSDRFKGIGRGTWSALPQQPDRLPGGAPSFATRPTLLLRHSGRESWSVVLDVPSFRHIAIDPDIHAFLKNARCRLNGARDLKARGWLLSGNRKAVLRSWPDPAQSLIELEEEHGRLDHLLAQECRITPGPFWLFGLGDDGLARHIRSGVVRPGRPYIVVTTDDCPVANERISACNLNCIGATAFLLKIPAHVSAEFNSWIDAFGLQVARTIRVWPAGLPGRGWDGEGSSEWLTTEDPCFGFCHDHAVESYSCQLDDRSETIIRTKGDNKGTTFIRLPPLPVGTYTLTVKAQRSPELDIAASSPAAQGVVELTVREPEPWTPDLASHPGLVVAMDPVDSDFQSFWRNETAITVTGPDGHTAALTVMLETSDGTPLLNERIGRPFTLPVTATQWKSSFGQYLQRKAQVLSDCLETAVSGTLTVNGESLGTRMITFQREVDPVRWKIHDKNNDVTVRLIDEGDVDDVIVRTYRYGLEDPLTREPIATERAMSGMVVTAPGSLFVVEYGASKGAAAVSTIPTQQGFRGLAISPKINAVSRSPRALREVCRVLSLWRNARRSGFHIEERHFQIEEAIADRLYETICGKNWSEAEAEARKLGPALANERLMAQVDKNAGFAAELAGGLSQVGKSPAERSRWFSTIAARYNICKSARYCELTLRLASEPQALEDLAAAELEALFAEIVDSPALLRGGRLLALMTAECGTDNKIPTLPGWQW